MDLIECRNQINEIDDEMKALFLKRMEVVKNVALYKIENNMPIFDASREASMKERLSADTGDMKEYYLAFLEETVKQSKEYQKKIIDEINR